MSPRAALPASELAWPATLVVGAAFALAAVLLGPPLGELLVPAPLDFLDEPGFAFVINPEPTELARSLIAIAAPLAVAAAVLGLAGRPAPARVHALLRPGAFAAQAICLAIALVALLDREPDFGDADLATFSALAICFAAVVAVTVVSAACSPRARELAARIDARASRAGPGAALAGGVVALTIAFLLPAVYTESALGASDPYVWSHLQVTFEDFVAVGNGLTPTVDYASQYAHVLPFALAPLLTLTDYQPASFTVIATALTLAALLAVWATLRIVTASRLAGALLYLPLLAAGSLPFLEAGDERAFNANVYQLLPLRYLGPFAIAWLLARRLAGRRAPGQLGLFALAGLTALNNPEFGLPCFGALAIALALADREDGGPPRPHDLGPLALRAAGGALIALTALAAVTLARAGELPDPGELLFHTRTLVAQGWYLVPIAGIGLFALVYLTLGGAVVLAAVRAASAATDRTLTGLLAYAGVLGLGAGLYYAGRSLPEHLVALYPVWGLAVALLAWAAVRALAAAPSALAGVVRIGVGGIVVLVCAGLMLSTLTAIPAPWTQAERVAADVDSGSPLDVADAAAFVARETEPGEKVAFVATMGHYTAREAGVDDVSPINSSQHVISSLHLERVLDAADRAGARALFTTTPAVELDPATGLTEGDSFPLWRGIADGLEAAGWLPAGSDPEAELTVWRRPSGT